MARLGSPWLVAVALCALGCVSTEPLERDLRQKEGQISRLTQDAQTSGYHLEVCRRENEALRTQLEQPGRQPLLPEQAARMFSLKEIALAARGTGGLNSDNLPGDDGIQVLIEPRDGQGDVVKSPGSLSFELFDLAGAESQRRVGYWEFSLQDTAARWQSGWLSQGYRFELPWQAGYPRHADLTLHVRLTTPDGRQFDATRQIRVEPMPSQLPPSVPAKPTIAPVQPSLPASPVDPALKGPVLPGPTPDVTPARPALPRASDAPSGPSATAPVLPSGSPVPPTASLTPARRAFSPVAQPPWRSLGPRKTRDLESPSSSDAGDRVENLAERPQRSAICVPYPYHEPGRVQRF